MIERQRGRPRTASEDFNRRIIESVPCGIVQVSLKGTILQANPVGQKLLGLTSMSSRRFVGGFESETFWRSQDHPVSKWQ